MGPQRKPFPRSLLLIVTIVAIGLAAGRSYFLHLQENALLREEGETLDSIAVLKVDEVSRWRNDRLAETTAIAANSLFNEQLRPILEGQAGSSADQVREWMQALLRADGEYTRVQLVAADDTVRMSVPPATLPISESDRALIDEAFRMRQAVMSDFHIDDPAEGPSLGVAVPLLVGGPDGPAPVGALFLRIDPDVYLYPLIQSWPTSNQSGETLLVKKEGADVLYLNELRFQSGTALVLRVPLSQTSLPASMAVTGQQGMVEGVDYRGVRVIAALRPVQSTPWFMVSKIDRQEALAPLGTLGWLTGGVIISLLLALAGGVEWVWRRQATTELRRELSLRMDRDNQAQRAEYFWKYANDSILLADLTGRIVEANDRAVTSMGYPREQLVGMDLRDLRVPEQRAMVDELMRQAREQGGCIAEANYRRGDGSVLAAEVSARAIELAGQQYYLSVIRDISERKQVEGNLRESEGRYRSLFENMLEGYAYCRMFFEDGRPQDFLYLAVNDAFETLTGLKDVVGRRVSDVIPGIRQSDPQLFEVYGRVARTGKPETFEIFVEALNIWFHISVYSPKTEHFVAVFDVITERKRIEAALRASEQRFRGTLDSMLEGCQIVDGDWRYIYVNDAAARHSRRAKEELLGRTMMECYPGIEKSSMFAAAQRCREENIAVGMENQFTYPDGASGWFDLSMQLIPEGVFILSVDITERKRAEAALRHYTEQLKAASRVGSLISTSLDLSEIFDTLARELAGFLPIDRASLILLDDTGENWQVARLWTSHEPVLTAGIWRPLAESHIGAVVTGRAPLLEREIGETGEWPDNDLIRQEGIHSRVLLPLIVQGRVIGVLTLGSRTPGAYTEEDAAALQLFADQLAAAVQNSRLFDEIHRRAAELEQRVLERTAQLEASNKELEAFAYSVSHDLRAPLRAVDGFSRIVIEEYGDKLDAEGKRLLNVVRTNTRQMDQLIADLLELSRATRTEMRLSDVDMTALAQSVYTELVPPGDRGGLEVCVAPLPVALGDPTLLRLVWANLLENAVKYTKPKKERRIDVGGYTDEDMGVYFVKDNGAGFDPQYTHKLFGVFQRLHRTEEFEGTGIGLAIVQRIVHRHGGRVWAEGEVGAGATFYFALPKRGV